MTVVVVVACLAGLDLGLRWSAERAVERSVARSTHAGHVSVKIHSFPFLYDVLGEAHVDRFDLVSTDVPAGPFRLDRVSFDARSIDVDHWRMLNHRTFKITSIGSATVETSVHLTGIVGLLASTLDLQVTNDGSNHLTISTGGRPVAVLDLSSVALIPRCAFQTQRVGETYTFDCTVSPVPPPVIAALNDLHDQFGN